MAMTVSEAARHFKVSRSTIYRRISSGELTAIKVNRRWVIQEPAMDWHPQIHRPTAEQDGRTSEDFTWLDYPVSNVRLSLPHKGTGNWTLTYEADMPPDTPQVNQLSRAEEREEGKEYAEAVFGDETWYELLVRGSALSRVVFKLIDMADHAILHESATGHEDGKVQGGMTEGYGALLWERLTPGTTLRVRLEATALFFPYNNPETGSGGNEYSNVNNGYLGSDVSFDVERDLTMTRNDVEEPPHLLLDGMPAADAPAFELQGQSESESFHEWLKSAREAITAKDSWVTAEVIAGQVGMDVTRYENMEAGTATPENWERQNIEDAIKGWQAYLSSM